MLRYYNTWLFLGGTGLRIHSVGIEIHLVQNLDRVIMFRSDIMLTVRLGKTNSSADISSALLGHVSDLELDRVLGIWGRKTTARNYKIEGRTVVISEATT